MRRKRSLYGCGVWDESLALSLACWLWPTSEPAAAAWPPNSHQPVSARARVLASIWYRYCPECYHRLRSRWSKVCTGVIDDGLLGCRLRRNDIIPWSYLDKMIIIHFRHVPLLIEEFCSKVLSAGIKYSPNMILRI